MGNELVGLIDCIQEEQCVAESNVISSLVDVYTKSLTVLENCDEDTDISAFDVFQEGALSDAVNEAKGDKSENIIIRIIKFIPRLIAAFIRNVRNSRKGVETRMNSIKKLASKLKKSKGDKKVTTEAYGLYTDNDVDVDVTVETDIIDAVKLLSRETVDFGAVFLPLQNALEEIVDALTDGDREDKEWDRELLADEVGRRRRHGETAAEKQIMSEIQNNLSEAEQLLAKQTANLPTNIKTIADTAGTKSSRIMTISLNTIMHEYHSALDWMKYVESILQTAQKQIQRITNITGSNAKLTKQYKSEGINVSFAGRVTNKNLSGYVKRCQSVVQNMETLYGNAIKICFKGLDQMNESIIKQAKDAGISMSEYGASKRSRAEYHGLSNSELYGYVNGQHPVKAGKRITAS